MTAALFLVPSLFQGQATNAEPTNWLTAAERSGRLGTIAGWVVGIGVAVILVRMWAARRRSATA